MSNEISATNQARLTSTAQAQGVSVDAYVEHLLNEHEELVAIVARAAGEVPNDSSEDTPSRKIERGFVQAERGDVAWLHSLRLLDER